MLDPLALAVYCYLIFLFSFCLWHRDMKMHLIIVFFLFFSLLPTYFCSFFFSFHLNEIVGHAKDWPSTRSSSEEKKKEKENTNVLTFISTFIVCIIRILSRMMCVFLAMHQSPYSCTLAIVFTAAWPNNTNQEGADTFLYVAGIVHFGCYSLHCPSFVLTPWNVNLGSTSRYFQYILKRKSTMTMTDNITNWKLSNRDMFYDVIRLIWSAIWRYEVETIAWLCWRQRATYPNSTCLDRAQ